MGGTWSQNGPIILGLRVRPGGMKEVISVGPPLIQCRLVEKAYGVSPVHEVKGHRLHVLVQISEVAADSSDAKKRAVRNAVPTLLRVSQRIQKIVVRICLFTVQVCVNLMIND